jgi:hypothetical protein
MHDQTTAPACGGINGDRAPGLAEQVMDDGPALDDLGQHPVAVLSAAVLKAARQRYRESQADFAVRAGVTPDVVAGAEDETRPSWALSYSGFVALANAISALDPGLLGVFETATACDLILSCVLDGDQTFATDVLMKPGSRDLARSLLRLAITGKSAGDLTVVC